MFFPPSTNLSFLNGPPTTRPVYDNPPVISTVPRWRRLRTLGAHLTRRPLPATASIAPRSSPPTRELTPALRKGR
jgi:hypothetical protein